jgi:hypothetical protein
MANILVGEPLLLLSQATSTTAHVTLGLINLLGDSVGLQDHLRLALGGPAQLPLAAPGLLELEPLGDP